MKLSDIIQRFYQRYHKMNAMAYWDMSDVYLVSYPKSGTTWMCLLLANVLREIRQEPLRIDFINVHDYIPDLHANPERILQISPPRIIKTHESFSEWFQRIVIRGRGVIFPRVLYLLRDGRDATASYYQYVNALLGEHLIFSKFLKGCKHSRGGWADHVRHWLIENTSIDERLLFIVRFEDLRLDTAGTLRKVLDFIGLETTEQQIENAVHLSDINRLRNLETVYGGGVMYHDTQYAFTRQGEKRQVQKELKDAIENYYQENMSVFSALGYH